MFLASKKVLLTAGFVSTDALHSEAKRYQNKNSFLNNILGCCRAHGLDVLTDQSRRLKNSPVNVHLNQKLHCARTHPHWLRPKTHLYTYHSTQSHQGRGMSKMKPWQETQIFAAPNST